MDPIHDRSSSEDYFEEYLIAFLVLLGASIFIYQQSFPDQSATIATTNVRQATTPPQQTTTYRKPPAEKEISYLDKKRAEQDFADDAIREWTEDLEQKDIKNTSFRIPNRTSTRDIPLTAAAATIPLTSEATPSKKAPEKEVANQPKVISKSKNVVKDNSVFIDTSVKEGGEQQQAASTTTKKNIQQTPPEQVIQTYEDISPTISVQKEQGVAEKTTPKKVTKKAPAKKKASRKKKKFTKEAKNCVIVIAALQDAGNIKRLVQSLKSEKYTIYNKQVGKHRSIGIKTSCNPSVYTPLLKRIKRDYSQDAWFSKR